MNKENDGSTMYTCANLCDLYYCKLDGKKPTGSIKGDIVGKRLCIQKLPAKHKRGVVCDSKKLVAIK